MRVCVNVGQLCIRTPSEEEPAESQRENERERERERRHENGAVPKVGKRCAVVQDSPWLRESYL